MARQACNARPTACQPTRYPHDSNDADQRTSRPVQA